MLLSELIQGVDYAGVTGDTAVDVTSIVLDSRKVTKGALFAALRGFAVDGNLFAPDAVRKGAVAVLTDGTLDISGATVVRVPDARRVMALLADRFYGSPQESLVMTGVTGTNGKTTTTYMVKSIFEAGGMGCGVIGTIKHIVGKRNIQSLNTTPEAPDIHAMLADMVAAKQTACAMEVSSHSLSLSRVSGIRFRAAAFTNLTRDHLDFHSDFQSYLDAKSILFANLSGDATAVINRDDPSADHIIAISKNANVITFGESEKSDIRPVFMKLGPKETNLILALPGGEISIILPIPGRFNVSNAMAAAGIGLASGLPAEIVARGLETVKTVRGRYEIVDEGQPFVVIVDYAHTPDALERILSSAREITAGRLISIFGCGGDRDRGKRPMMGGISTRIADISVVTSDNPRTEDPIAIIDDIIPGIDAGASYEIVPDREEAIGRALALAKPGDTVVIAGKGHEDYQIVGTEKRHFDDAEIARRFLRGLR